MLTNTGDMMETSATLLERLRDLGDDASWKRFVDQYKPLIKSVVHRYGFTEAAAEDIVQETLEAVARQMPQFHYDPNIGSFKTWLRQITRSRIFDALRRTRYKQQDHYTPREIKLSTSLMESYPAPEEKTNEQIWEEEWRNNQLERALKEIRRTTTPREYQMFYLHVIKNVPAQDVAKGFRAKLSQVYATKYRLERRLKREIKRLEKEG